MNPTTFVSPLAAVATLALCSGLASGCVTRTVYVVDDTPTAAAAPRAQSVAVAPQADPVAYEDDAGIADPYDFVEPLMPYGSWEQYPGYGLVFRPSVAVVGSSFRPYSHGHWEYTEWGWTWADHHPFGWATGHYGRWFYDARQGWLWVPGTQWSPAWVTWRQGGGYYGWAAMPPGSVYGGRYAVYETSWLFVSSNNMGGAYVGTYIVTGNRYRSCYSSTRPYRSTTVVYGRNVYRGPDYNEVSRHSRVIHRPIRETQRDRPVTRPPTGTVSSRDRDRNDRDPGRSGRDDDRDDGRVSGRDRDGTTGSTGRDRDNNGSSGRDRDGTTGTGRDRDNNGSTGRDRDGSTGRDDDRVSGRDRDGGSSGRDRDGRDGGRDGNSNDGRTIYDNGAGSGRDDDLTIRNDGIRGDVVRGDGSSGRDGSTGRDRDGNLGSDRDGSTGRDRDGSTGRDRDNDGRDSGGSVLDRDGDGRRDAPVDSGRTPGFPVSRDDGDQRLRQDRPEKPLLDDPSRFPGASRSSPGTARTPSSSRSRPSVGPTPSSRSPSMAPPSSSRSRSLNPGTPSSSTPSKARSNSKSKSKSKSDSKAKSSTKSTKSTKARSSRSSSKSGSKGRSRGN